jgi:hypothetical protein
MGIVALNWRNQRWLLSTPFRQVNECWLRVRLELALPCRRLPSARFKRSADETE